VKILENTIRVRSWGSRNGLKIPEVANGYSLCELNEIDMKFGARELLEWIENQVTPDELASQDLKFHHFFVRENGDYTAISVLQDFGVSELAEINFYDLYQALRKIGWLS